LLRRKVHRKDSNIHIFVIKLISLENSAAISWLSRDRRSTHRRFIYGKFRLSSPAWTSNFQKKKPAGGKRNAFYHT